MDLDLNERILMDDAIDLLCGRLIGKGLTRQVFDCNLMDDCVVKIEKEPGEHRQNFKEWDVWCAVRDTPFAKWFAPIEWCSTNGRILIMKKTWRPGPNDYPKQIPAFFTDIHLGNFGLNAKPDPDNPDAPKALQLVAHDYGFTRLMKIGLTRKMQTVDWDNYTPMT